MIFVVLGSRRSHAGRAWKKIGLIILGITMIAAAISPESISSFANFLGIGRGADLLLYALTAAFIVYTLNAYLHGQDERDTTIRLARKISLIDAIERYKLKKL
jgi:hypothetical protein